MAWREVRQAHCAQVLAFCVSVCPTATGTIPTPRHGVARDGQSPCTRGLYLPDQVPSGSPAPDPNRMRAIRETQGRNRIAGLDPTLSDRQVHCTAALVILPLPRQGMSA